MTRSATISINSNSIDNRPFEVAHIPNQTHQILQYTIEMSRPKDLKKYWNENIRIVLFLLAIWFAVGFGVSILFIEQLNQIKIGNLGLGFWFAQQGSIFVFILLVLAYAIWMDRLDRKYEVGD